MGVIPQMPTCQEVSVSLIHRLRPTTGLQPTAGAHDPFWDLDGSAVKRSRIRQQMVGGVALALSIVACGLSTAAWLREIGPFVGIFGG